jgi:hypothetical protein
VPIITFIRDILSAVNGPYHRTVGKYTHQFCRRATRLAGNEVQRKILLVAAVSADDYIGAMLGVSENIRRFAAAANTRGKWSGKHVPDAMRIYLSVLLIVLGTYKDAILKNAGLDERRFLELWCATFEYRPADREQFDKRLSADYQGAGIDGLIASAAAGIYALLFPGTVGADNHEAESMKMAVLKDISAILRNITKPEEKEGCS